MANFDLSELTRHGNPAYYQVTDGDIPCTKSIEKNFTYSFNVCGNVGKVDKCKKPTFDLREGTSLFDILLHLTVCPENAAAVQFDTIGDNSDVYALPLPLYSV